MFSNNWFADLSVDSSVDELVANFSSGAINTIFSLKTVRLHPTDKPWMTTSIKQLIKDHQSAFHCGETTQWQRLSAIGN